MYNDNNILLLFYNRYTHMLWFYFWAVAVSNDLQTIFGVISFKKKKNVSWQKQVLTIVRIFGRNRLYVNVRKCAKLYSKGV